LGGLERMEESIDCVEESTLHLDREMTSRVPRRGEDMDPRRDLRFAVHLVEDTGGLERTQPFPHCGGGHLRLSLTASSEVQNAHSPEETT